MTPEYTTETYRREPADTPPDCQPIPNGAPCKRRRGSWGENEGGDAYCLPPNHALKRAKSHLSIDALKKPNTKSQAEQLLSDISKQAPDGQIVMIVRGYGIGFGRDADPYKSKEIHEVPLDCISKLIEMDTTTSVQEERLFILSLIYHASAKKRDSSYYTVKCIEDNSVSRQEAPADTNIAAWVGIFDLDLHSTWPGKQAFVDYMKGEEVNDAEYGEAVKAFNTLVMVARHCIQHLEKNYKDCEIAFYFSGGKGIRILAFHPQLFASTSFKRKDGIAMQKALGQYQADVVLGQDVWRSIQSELDSDKDRKGEDMKYLNECNPKLCLDDAVFKHGGGVKTDLYPHYKTGIYPCPFDLGGKIEDIMKDLRSKRLGIGGSGRIETDKVFTRKIGSAMVKAFQHIKEQFDAIQEIPSGYFNDFLKDDLTADSVRRTKRSSSERKSSTRTEPSSACTRHLNVPGQKTGSLHEVCKLIVQIDPAICDEYDQWKNPCLAICTALHQSPYRLHIVDCFSICCANYGGFEDIERKFRNANSQNKSSEELKGIGSLHRYSKKSNVLVFNDVSGETRMSKWDFFVSFLDSTSVTFEYLVFLVRVCFDEPDGAVMDMLNGKVCRGHKRFDADGFAKTWRRAGEVMQAAEEGNDGYATFVCAMKAYCDERLQDAGYKPCSEQASLLHQESDHDDTNAELERDLPKLELVSMDSAQSINKIRKLQLATEKDRYVSWYHRSSKLEDTVKAMIYMISSLDPSKCEDELRQQVYFALQNEVKSRGEQEDDAMDYYMQWAASDEGAGRKTREEWKEDFKNAPASVRAASAETIQQAIAYGQRQGCSKRPFELKEYVDDIKFEDMFPAKELLRQVDVDHSNKLFLYMVCTLLGMPWGSDDDTRHDFSDMFVMMDREDIARIIFSGNEDMMKRAMAGIRNPIKQNESKERYIHASRLFVLEKLYSFESLKDWLESCYFCIAETKDYRHVCFKDRCKYFESLTEEELKSRMQNYYYLTFDKKGNIHKHSFILDYLKYPNRTVFKFAVIEPQKALTYVDPVYDMKPRVLNTWGGFRAERLNIQLTEEEVMSLSQPFLDHLYRVHASGKEDRYQYIIAWLANIIQHPENKQNVVLVFNGEEGCGKNLPLDLFREHVLGDPIVWQACGLSGVFQKFNSHVAGKVFVQLDEISKEDMKRYREELKNFVTTEVLDTERKYSSKSRCKNLVNLVITSNHESPVHISSSDRRFVLLPCSSDLKKVPGYMQTMTRQWKTDVNQRDRSARAIYLRLRHWDIDSKYQDMSSARPCVEEYLEARCENIDIFERYICHLCVVNDAAASKVVQTFTAAVFCQDLLCWAAANNYKEQAESIDPRKVGMRLAALMKKVQCSDIPARLGQDQALALGSSVQNGIKNYTCRWDLLKKQLEKVDLFRHLMKPF